MLLNELTDGMEIDQVLLVREAERRRRRDGGDYLRLQLGDRTGAVACMVWEELGEVERLACAGAAVRVLGRYTVHPRFGPQINLRGLEEATPGSYSPEDLLDGPARSVEQMEGEVRELLDDGPGATPAHAARARVRRGLGAVGRLPRWRRLPSTTTRPTATACSSTASGWLRR